MMGYYVNSKFVQREKMFGRDQVTKKSKLQTNNINYEANKIKKKVNNVSKIKTIVLVLQKTLFFYKGPKCKHQILQLNESKLQSY